MDLVPESIVHVVEATLLVGLAGVVLVLLRFEALDHLLAARVNEEATLAIAVKAHRVDFIDAIRDGWSRMRCNDVEPELFDD